MEGGGKAAPKYFVVCVFPSKIVFDRETGKKNNSGSTQFSSKLVPRCSVSSAGNVVAHPAPADEEDVPGDAEDEGGDGGAQGLVEGRDMLGEQKLCC